MFAYVRAFALSSAATMFAACSLATSRIAPSADATADRPRDAPTDRTDASDVVRTLTRCDTTREARIGTVGRLFAGRYSPAVARLADGRVLIAGGFDFNRGILASTEVFNPSDDSLSEGPPLAVARNFATTTLLADGTVLVAGGFDDRTGSTTSAELFDPVADEFRATDGGLALGREAHTATRLPDGRVLVAGGLQARGLRFLTSAELYDTERQRFVAVTALLQSARGFHAAAWVPARREVLIVGGDSGNGELATAERYDPARGTFSATAGGRAHAGKALAAVTLRDGRVLVTGGANASDRTLADADLYDPATDRFSPVAPMRTRRMAHTLTLLRDGRVLAVGGWSDSTTPSASAAPLEVYDPVANTWELLPVRLAEPRHDHAAVLLDDCRVLVVGGQQVTGDARPAAPRGVEAVLIPSRDSGT